MSRLSKTLLASTLLACTLGSASASEFLASLNGSWKGTGEARPASNQPRETVRCRVKNSYVVASKRLVVRGLCAVPGRKFDMKGTVSSDPDSDQISGRWSNPFGAGSTSVRGRQTGDIIQLNFVGRDEQTGKKQNQEMIWRLVKGGFEIVTRLADNPETELGRIRFAR